MARKTARDVIGVMLGEATSGTLHQRYNDMLGIASAIHNRAVATGKSVQSVISAKGQFDAFGKALPRGTETFAGLAQAAWDHVTNVGPVHPGTYYATPAAAKNLPKGLTPVASTTGHVYYTDPQNRAIRTATGYAKPNPRAVTMAYARDTTQTGEQRALAAIDSVFGAPSAPMAPAAAQPVSAPAMAAPAGSMQFSNPLGVQSNRATSEFGGRVSPMGIGSTDHQGVDLSAAPGVGGYPAQAAAGGTVSFAGPLGGYGLSVRVSHPDGTITQYSHLESINPSMQVGAQIARGTPVGLVGNTGKSTRDHLHFGVYDAMGRAIDPRSVTDLSAPSAPTPSSRPARTPAQEASLAQGYAQAAGSMSAAGIMGMDGRTAGPDPSRFAGRPSISVSSPVSPAEGYAVATDNQAKQDRVGAAAESRFAGPNGPVSVQGPYSPAEGYATAEAPTAAPSAGIDPSRFGTPTTNVSFSQLTGQPAKASTPKARETATNLGPFGGFSVSEDDGTPAVDPASFSKVSLSKVGPEALSTGSLSQPKAYTALTNPSDYSSFAQVPGSLMENVSISPTTITDLAAIAPPADIAPPPVTYSPPPAVRTAADSIKTGAIAAPSLSVGDVYGGQIGSAIASDGSTVSRDRFGNVSITNKYGATTATMPSGKQAAVWGGVDTGPGDTEGGGLFGGFGGLGSGLGTALGGAARNVAGSLLGGAAGNAIAGPIGGMIGAEIGRSLMSKYGSLGGLGGFPAAPGPAPSGSVRGGDRTAAERNSRSPAAAGAIGSGKAAGLY